VINDPGVMGVYSCFTATCATQCAAVLPDAGAEGGTEPGDAGTTTAADAGDGG
jgi:hypothetical protein